MPRLWRRYRGSRARLRPAPTTARRGTGSGAGRPGLGHLPHRPDRRRSASRPWSAAIGPRSRASRVRDSDLAARTGRRSAGGGLAGHRARAGRQPRPAPRLRRTPGRDHPGDRRRRRSHRRHHEAARTVLRPRRRTPARDGINRRLLHRRAPPVLRLARPDRPAHRRTTVRHRPHPPPPPERAAPPPPTDKASASSPTASSNNTPTSPSTPCPAQPHRDGLDHYRTHAPDIEWTLPSGHTHTRTPPPALGPGSDPSTTTVTTDHVVEDHFATTLRAAG